MENFTVESFNKTPLKQLVALAALYYFVNRNKLLYDKSVLSENSVESKPEGKYYNILNGSIIFNRSSGYFTHKSGKKVIDNKLFGIRLPAKGEPSILYPYLRTEIRAFATSIHLENLENQSDNNSSKLKNFDLKSQVEDFYSAFLSKLNSGLIPTKKVMSESQEKLAIYCDYTSWADFIERRPKHTIRPQQVKDIQDGITKKEDDIEFDRLVHNIYSGYLENNRSEICYLTITSLLAKLNFNINIFLKGKAPEKELGTEIAEELLVSSIEKADNGKEKEIEMVDYFIPKDEIMDIEFEENAKLNITIITSSLKWASYHHKKIKDSGIYKANNSYRYILTGWTPDRTYKHVAKLREIRKGLPDPPEKYPDGIKTEPDKSSINLLKIKDQFLTLYFGDSKIFRDKIDAVNYSNYIAVKDFIYENLDSSFILEKGAFFNPFDYVIIENLNPNNPIVKKYIGLSIGESENEPKSFVIMEMNSMSFIEGDYSNNLLAKKMYFDTFVPLEVGEKIKIWAENVWKLFDEKIAPKGSDNRGKYFLLEVDE